MTITNRVALITDSGSGIGEGVAKVLAANGAKVIINDTDSRKIDRVVSEIREENGTAIGIKADLTNPEEVKNMVETIVKEYGRLDILVNNADISLSKKMIESDIEDWDRVLDTNLKSMFITSKYAAPEMMKQNFGRIINISSRDWLGIEDHSIYSASKGGVVSFSRTLALELAKHQITSNAICPGLVETPDFESSTTQDVKEQLKASQPTRSIGKPEDIAQGVLFLAADESSYITGQTLFICGGRSLYSSLSV